MINISNFISCLINYFVAFKCSVNFNFLTCYHIIADKKIKWRKLDITEMEDGFRCAVEQELESCHLQSTNSDLKGRSGCRGGSNHISESISVDYKVWKLFLISEMYCIDDKF